MYDVDIIYSWTPREFKNFIKGARLRQIDEHERDSISALFNAVAQNSKKKNLKPKDIFDSEKARKQIDSVESVKEPEKYLGRYHAAQAAMKAYRPQKGSKGG